MSYKILLIDDQWGRLEDPMIPETYGSLDVEWIRESAESATGGHSVERAMSTVRSERSHLAAILLDINFGSEGERLGVDILRAVRNEFPTLPVLMFTSLDSDEYRELVIQCMELGANEYVEKAPSAEQMARILSTYTDPSSDSALYGNSIPVRQMRAKIARVAFSGETSVLIVGESGTGKELVAKALHRQGPRKQGPFVAKNCAHSDLQLLDSELFGHEKGAFTGAISQRRGLIEEADGGVLFLDEIADMPSELQAKLLRTLESRTFRRIGGSQDLKSEFQLICATNQKPEDLIQTGRLREDFYYRIATMTLHVPVLRERKDDIPALAELFLKRFKARGGASYPGTHFPELTLKRLQGHSWPGNVRELRNVVERAVILSPSKKIGVEVLPEPFASNASSSARANRVTTYGSLPDITGDWPATRLKNELRLAVEAMRRIREYKGNQWKAEFMRLMYPECKAANAKGFDDLIKRLTKGPWGNPEWKTDPEMSRALRELMA